jgi:hypothetical protein
MTEEEKVMLREIYAAFFEPPIGSGADGKALIEEIRIIIAAYKRANWLSRMIFVGIPLLSGMVIAIRHLLDTFNV